MFYVSTIKGWEKKVKEFPMLALLETPVFSRLPHGKVEFHILPDDQLMPTWVRLLSCCTILYQRPDKSVDEYEVWQEVDNVTVAMDRLFHEEDGYGELTTEPLLLAVVVDNHDGMRVAIFKKFDLRRFVAEYAAKASMAAVEAEITLDQEEYPDGIDPYDEKSDAERGKTPSQLDAEFEEDDAVRKDMTEF